MAEKGEDRESHFFMKYTSVILKSINHNPSGKIANIGFILNISKTNVKIKAIINITHTIFGSIFSSK